MVLCLTPSNPTRDLTPSTQRHFTAVSVSWCRRHCWLHLLVKPQANTCLCDGSFNVEGLEQAACFLAFRRWFGIFYKNNRQSVWLKLRLRHLVTSYSLTLQCESNNHTPCGFLTFFPKGLGIFNQFFTHLLCVPIYAWLQIFIQLSPILTKLCHIKWDHPSNFWHFTRT